MGFYMDEQQAFKCPKHPSKRRRTGICPKCLHQRLLTLCPHCANNRPCACSHSPPPPDTSSSSSNSSSSTSFSLFSFSRSGSRHNIGLSNNHEIEPALRKSRSVAISLFRSRSRHVGTGIGEIPAKKGDGLPAKVSRRKINFWSMFTVSNNNKSKGSDVHDDGSVEEVNNGDGVMVVDESNSVMMRSRSVAVGECDGDGNRFVPASLKAKGWYFPSPINGFRYSKSTRSVPVT